MRSAPASRYSVALAFAILYTSWGTTYLAIKIGLETLPPCLFSGTRLSLAGGVLLAWLALRGNTLRMDRASFLWVALSGLCFFMGGNGMLTYAQTMIPSSMAAVLVTQTPLWFALMESMVPGGERLTIRGWLGLLLGMLGVVLLKYDWETGFPFDLGFLLATGSSIIWSVGSLIVRHRTPQVSPFVAAGLQMLIGGLALTVVGFSVGEAARVSMDSLTRSTVLAFFYLLLVGSLGGFVAYNYVLAHVSPALASTYAFVNPLIAVWVGWLILDETVTLPMLGCMAIILAGVALIRTGGVRKVVPLAEEPSVPRQSGVHLAAKSVDAACKR